jgi:uncharacterized protein YxjI
MPIPVQCLCGVLYNLKDEFAGKLLQCPSCGEHIRAPQSRHAGSGPFATVFDREKFLLRQKHFAIAEKYYVRDEAGNELLFVERPARLLARIGAFFLAIFLAIFLQVFTGFQLPGFFTTIFLLLAFYSIKPKRNITFYENDSKQQCLLELNQDKWFQMPEASFTLKDDQGNSLGTFRKNQFTDFWRKRWRFYLPDGRLLLTVREDSIILSILRRITGLLMDFAIFRTNFVIYAGDSDQVLGEFNRKLTILDRYLLDMSPDIDQTVDRRVAVALGVLLDTGEGR